MCYRGRVAKRPVGMYWYPIESLLLKLLCERKREEKELRIYAKRRGCKEDSVLEGREVFMCVCVCV